MLKRLTVKGFKSLRDVTLELPAFTVLFGPNTAGKSNVLDAIQALSRLGTSRTLSDALAEPIRGYPVEAFAFPAGGLPALLAAPQARFSVDAEVEVGRDRFRYRVAVAIRPESGLLQVDDEYLATLGRAGEPRGNPQIERVDGKIRIRRKSKPAHPREEPIGLNHTILSDPRLGGVEYRQIDRCREELSGWRSYYLDPRVAMRSARAPAEVRDIGVLGEDIAPFLFRLRNEKPQLFLAAQRTLRSLIPSVERLDVDLDKRRGTLDIQVRQDGNDYSSRIISEGTLRVLALCAIAVNPWSGSLLAFEEPENGVHPRRIDLIAELLASLPLRGRQVVVTTHSPLFCDAVLRLMKQRPGEVALLHVQAGAGGTTVRPFASAGPLFERREIAEALSAAGEDGDFTPLVLRGMLDE